MTNDFDIIKHFLDQYDKEVRNLARLNILIAGKTGVGKSTLINAVFREQLAKTGVGVPVTQHLQKISKEGVPLVIYDTKGMELKQDTQNQIRKEILEEIAKPLRKNNPEEMIHICWYCINATSNRIETYEIEWIRELAQHMPVIIVLTQVLGDNFLPLFHEIEKLNLPIQSMVPVLAKSYPISSEINLETRGLQQLVDRTIETVPEAQRISFINAQKVDIKRKYERANKAVLGYTSTAFATGFTPVPFADATVLVPMQVGMIAHLTSIYGLPLDKSLLSSVISSVLGTGGATIIGRNIVGSLFKLVPGAGSALGGVISGGTAASVTAALGYAYNKVMLRYAAGIYNNKKINKENFASLLKEAFQQEILKNKSRFLKQSKPEDLAPPDTAEEALKQLSETSQEYNKD